MSTRQPPRPPAATARQPAVLTERGSCATYPYPLWTSDSRADREAAAAICARCPVQLPCLTYAVTALPATDPAIWAGTGPRERTALRRAARLAAAA